MSEVDPKVQAALEQGIRNMHWLALQFLFGGDEGYRRASAFMEQNCRQAEASRKRES